MFIKRTSFTLCLAFVCLQSLASDCRNGVPYQPHSALAGAGFSEPPSKSALPAGWKIYEFRGASLPIPAELADRIVLLGDEEGVDHIYLQGDDPRQRWILDLTGRISVHENTGIPIELLFRNAISGKALEQESLEESECMKNLVSLLALDLFTDEDSSEAYDIGSALIMNGRSWDGKRWEIFWRDSAESLIHASWTLAFEDIGILAHFSASPPSQDPGNRFQHFFDCVSEGSPEQCQEIQLPGVFVESNPDFLRNVE